jgi:hypothetical protein
VGHPEVHRWRSLLEVDGQLRIGVVAQVDPHACEDESAITGRFAGRRFSRERAELAGHLCGQVWAQADEVAIYRRSHLLMLQQRQAIHSILILPATARVPDRGGSARARCAPVGVVRSPGQATGSDPHAHSPARVCVAGHRRLTRVGSSSSPATRPSGGSASRWMRRATSRSS